MASGEDITEVNAVGRYILITGGTNVDEYKQITAYDTDTKIATVDSAWTSNPDSSSTYLIVTKIHYLTEANPMEFDEEATIPSTGVPSRFAKYNHKLIFDKPFDLSTYGIFIRYFMHIHQVNLTEGNTTRIVRIARNWRNTLTNGIAYKTAESENDALSETFYKKYEEGIQSIMIHDIPYGGEFVGFRM